MSITEFDLAIVTRSTRDDYAFMKTSGIDTKNEMLLKKLSCDAKKGPQGWMDVNCNAIVIWGVGSRLDKDGRLISLMIVIQVGGASNKNLCTNILLNRVGVFEWVDKKFSDAINRGQLIAVFDGLTGGVQSILGRLQNMVGNVDNFVSGAADGQWHSAIKSEDLQLLRKLSWKPGEPPPPPPPPQNKLALYVVSAAAFFVGAVGGYFVRGKVSEKIDTIQSSASSSASAPAAVVPPVPAPVPAAATVVSKPFVAVYDIDAIGFSLENYKVKLDSGNFQQAFDEAVNTEIAANIKGGYRFVVSVYADSGKGKKNINLDFSKERAKLAVAELNKKFAATDAGKFNSVGKGNEDRPKIADNLINDDQKKLLNDTKKKILIIEAEKIK